MKKVTISRVSDNGGETLGTLTAEKENGQLFVCKTLELPWKDNQSKISCIPTGTYTCKYTLSNRMTQQKKHPVYTYEVLKVKGREGIRIHAANYYHQLLGCIALGDANADIDSDMQQDVLHSVATISAFEHLMNNEDFILEIK